MKNVLIFESSATQRERLQKDFQTEGCGVVAAFDEDDTLRIATLGPTKFNLIVLSIHRDRELSAVELAKHLINLMGKDCPPVTLITDLSPEELGRKYVGLNVLDIRYGNHHDVRDLLVAEAACAH